MSSVGEPSASLSSLLGRHSGQVVVVVLHCCRLLLIRPGPLACAMLDVLFGRLPTNTQFELLVIPPQKYLLLVKLGKWSGPANDFQLSLPATFTAARCCACSQLSTCAFLLLSQRPRGTTASPIEEQQVRNHPAPPMRDRDGRRRDGRGKPRDGRTKPTAAERKVTMPSISSRTRSLYCSFNFPR